MGRYTLVELEKLSGILAHTIRVWERRYDILKPQRTETNRRWYDDDDLRRLINISTLYHAGTKISRIAGLSNSELERMAVLQEKETSAYDVQINSLVVAMLSFNESAVNEVLLRSVISIGFEETIAGIVFPFLKRVGFLWQTGSVTAGTEHFVTHLLRNRLVSSIDSIPPANRHDKKRYMLFLPENELHELGLLFYAYLIRSAGHDILYLGQSTPFHSLVEACEKWQPDFLVTGALSQLAVPEPEDYLSRLGNAFPDRKILVSGSLAEAAANDEFPNVYPVTTVPELKKYL